MLIDLVQQGFGIVTIPPHVDNDLTQFLYVSISPLVEEFGFRVLLIGLPLFVFYSHKLSLKHFFKSLWSPSRNLHVYDFRKTLLLIVFVGIFFGLAHIMTGEPWSEGKFAQASAGGIILGWLYFRFGLIVSILVHWATNYFIFSYANFVSQINEIPIESADFFILPGEFQTILPKKLIHRVVPGEPIHDFFEAWKRSPAETASARIYGARQWFIATAERMAERGYDVAVQRKWLTKGYLIWKPGG